MGRDLSDYRQELLRTSRVPVNSDPWQPCPLGLANFAIVETIAADAPGVFTWPTVAVARRIRLARE